MGRYYDTRKAGYPWFDHKIPTEVAAIECFASAVEAPARQTSRRCSGAVAVQAHAVAWDNNWSIR